MFKKKPAVEWEFLSEADQNAPWPPAPQFPADQPAPRTCSRLRRAVLFSIAMTVLLTVGIGGAYRGKKR